MSKKICLGFFFFTCQCFISSENIPGDSHVHERKIKTSLLRRAYAARPCCLTAYWFPEELIPVPGRSQPLTNTVIPPPQYLVPLCFTISSLLILRTNTNSPPVPSPRQLIYDRCILVYQAALFGLARRRRPVRLPGDNATRRNHRRKTHFELLICVGIIMVTFDIKCWWFLHTLFFFWQLFSTVTTKGSIQFRP